MSTLPISPNPLSSLTNPAASSAPSTPSAASGAAQSSINALGDPDTFLKLLVAQLQYQDPESPADGTAFVTQLATFAGVEQQAQMRTDLDSIDQIAEAFAAPSAPTPAITDSTQSPTTPATSITASGSN